MAYLEALGASPQKRLSQNFLIDKNTIDKIVQQADVTANDTILEIGPGPGGLTDALCETGANVHVIEKDPLFAKGIRQRELPNLTVVEGDVLKEELPQATKVVANLPYNITTPILDKLFAHAPRFTSLTIMVQKEVADRMKAKPGTKEYGALSLFVAMNGHISKEHTVPRTCFYPRPSVTSSVLTIQLSENTTDPRVHTLIRHVFTKRRKMLRASLRDLFDDEQIASAPMDLTRRPESLSLTEFERLGTFFYTRENLQ